MPYANENRLTVVISKSTQAIEDIISAPGSGNRLAIDFITINPSGGANNITMTGTIAPVFVLNDNQPLTFENTIHNPTGVFLMNDNQAFQLTLSAATLVGGYIIYRIIN